MKFETNKFGRVNYFHTSGDHVTFGNMKQEDAEKFFENGTVSEDIPESMKEYGVTHMIDNQYFFKVLPEKKARKRRESTEI